MTTINPEQGAGSPPEETIEGLEGSYSVSLKINDNFVPFSPNLISDLSMISNVHNILPQLRIEGKDPYSVFTNDTFEITGNDTFGEGAKITVSLAPDSQSPVEPFEFINVGVPRVTPGQPFPSFIASCVLNAEKYWHGLVGGGVYSGNSHEVIQKIAGECGLGYHTPHNFNDKMDWMPGNKTFSKFAYNISSHAYSDPSSCPLIALDFDKILRYVDLNRIASEEPICRARFLKPLERDTDFEIVDYKVRLGSAADNMLGGYPTKLGGEKLDGSAFDFEEVDAIRHNSYLNISTDTKSQIERTGLKLAPLDMGNTHDNFFKARHQNERLSATFSTSVYILTYTFTGLGLFDVVELDMADQTDFSDQRNYSGVYFITMRRIGIREGQYYEKIRLTSNARGYNTKGLLV